MKKILKIAPLALAIAMAILLVSCSGGNFDPSKLDADYYIVSNSYDEGSGTSCLAVEITVANSSSGNISEYAYSLSLYDPSGVLLRTADFTYAGGIYSGETKTFTVNFGTDENSAVSGKVDRVKLSTLSASFASPGLGEASPAKIELFKKVSIAVILIGAALTLIGGLLLLFAKSENYDALKYVSSVFFVFGAPTAIVGLLGLLAPGLFWLFVAIISFVSTALLVISKVYAESTKYKRKWGFSFIDFIGYLSPIYLLLSILGFCLTFPAHIFVPIGLGVLAVGFLLFVYAADMNDSDTVKFLLMLSAIAVFAIGSVILINGFLENIFLSIGISCAVLFFASTFLFESGINIIHHLVLGGACAIGLFIGLFGDVWLMIGVLGAAIALCGIEYFFAYMIIDDVYGVDLDVLQTVGVPLAVGGSFLASFGLFSRFVAGAILSSALASVIGAVVGSAFYFTAFLYEKHLRKGKSYNYISRFDYKKMCQECVGVMKITGVVSTVSFITLATVMFIIQFVF